MAKPKNTVSPVADTTPVAVVKPEGKRGDSSYLHSPEAKKAAQAGRTARSLINRYLESHRSGETPSGAVAPSEKRATRILEIEEKLSKGTMRVPAPIWATDAAGVRTRTTTYKERALKPTERLQLSAELDALKSGGANRRKSRPVGASLRAEALAVLPGYTEKHGLSLGQLREVGFSDADLADAGLIPSPAAPNALPPFVTG